MQKTEPAKERAVMAFEVNREHGRLGLPDNPGNRLAPLPVNYAQAAQVHVGDLSSRKDTQSPPAPNPLNGLSQRLEVMHRRASPFERIYVNQQFVEVTDSHQAAQQKIGHDFGIASRLQHNRGENQAFNCAEGMVGHHNQRPFRRRFGQIVFGNLVSDAKHFKDAIRNWRLAWQRINPRTEVV